MSEVEGTEVVMRRKISGDESRASPARDDEQRRSRPDSCHKGNLKRLKTSSVGGFQRWEKENELLWAMLEDETEWLGQLFPDIIITSDLFFYALEDGIILCRLANLIQETAEEFAKNSNVPVSGKKFRFHRMIQKKNKQLALFKSRENVQGFLTWCRQLGISDSILFESNDIVEADECREGCREVVICLMEIARRAAGRFKFTPIPKLIQLEKEIEAEEQEDGESAIDHVDYVSMDEESTDSGHSASPDQSPPQNGHRDNDGKKRTKKQSKSELDKEVFKIIDNFNVYNIRKIKEGKYLILGKIIFVRMLNGHVLLRIGGGWDTLQHYLLTHIPKVATGNGHSAPEVTPSVSKTSQKPQRSKLLDKVKKATPVAVSSPYRSPAARKNAKQNESRGDDEKDITSAIRKIEFSVNHNITTRRKNPKVVIETASPAAGLTEKTFSPSLSDATTSTYINHNNNIVEGDQSSGSPPRQSDKQTQNQIISTETLYPTTTTPKRNMDEETCRAESGFFEETGNFGQMDVVDGIELNSFVDVDKLSANNGDAVESQMAEGRLEEKITDVVDDISVVNVQSELTTPDVAHDVKEEESISKSDVQGSLEEKPKDNSEILPSIDGGQATDEKIESSSYNGDVATAEADVAETAPSSADNEPSAVPDMVTYAVSEDSEKAAGDKADDGTVVIPCGDVITNEQAASPTQPSTSPAEKKTSGTPKKKVPAKTGPKEPLKTRTASARPTTAATKKSSTTASTRPKTSPAKTTTRPSSASVKTTTRTTTKSTLPPKTAANQGDRGPKTSAPKRPVTTRLKTKTAASTTKGEPDKKPDRTTRKPATTTTRPERTTKKPEGTAAKLADATKKPREPTRKPGEAATKPVGTTRPATARKPRAVAAKVESGLGSSRPSSAKTGTGKPLASSKNGVDQPDARASSPTKGLVRKTQTKTVTTLKTTKKNATGEPEVKSQTITTTKTVTESNGKKTTKTTVKQMSPTGRKPIKLTKTEITDTNAAPGKKLGVKKTTTKATRGEEKKGGKVSSQLRETVSVQKKTVKELSNDLGITKPSPSAISKGMKVNEKPLVQEPVGVVDETVAVVVKETAVEEIPVETAEQQSVEEISAGDIEGIESEEKPAEPVEEKSVEQVSYETSQDGDLPEKNALEEKPIEPAEEEVSEQVEETPDEPVFGEPVEQDKEEQVDQTEKEPVKPVEEQTEVGPVEESEEKPVEVEPAESAGEEPVNRDEEEPAEEKLSEQAGEEPVEKAQEKSVESTEGEFDEPAKEKLVQPDEEEPAEEKPSEAAGTEPDEPVEEEPVGSAEPDEKEPVEEKPSEAAEEELIAEAKETPEPAEEVSEPAEEQAVEEEPDKSTEEEPSEDVEEKPESVGEEPVEQEEEKLVESIGQESDEAAEEEPVERAAEEPDTVGELLEKEPSEPVEEDSVESCEDKPAETAEKEEKKEKTVEQEEGKPTEQIEEKPVDYTEEEPVKAGGTPEAEEVEQPEQPDEEELSKQEDEIEPAGETTNVVGESHMIVESFEVSAGKDEESSGNEACDDNVDVIYVPPTDVFAEVTKVEPAEAWSAVGAQPAPTGTEESFPGETTEYQQVFPADSQAYQPFPSAFLGSTGDPNKGIEFSAFDNNNMLREVSDTEDPEDSGGKDESSVIQFPQFNSSSQDGVKDENGVATVDDLLG